MWNASFRESITKRTTKSIKFVVSVDQTQTITTLVTKKKPYKTILNLNPRILCHRQGNYWKRLCQQVDAEDPTNMLLLSVRIMLCSFITIWPYYNFHQTQIIDKKGKIEQQLTTSSR